jgi:hypothetical protein
MLNTHIAQSSTDSVRKLLNTANINRTKTATLLLISDFYLLFGHKRKQ